MILLTALPIIQSLIKLLRSSATEIVNPAADQSQYQYELDSVVETIPKK